MKFFPHLAKHAHRFPKMHSVATTIPMSVASHAHAHSSPIIDLFHKIVTLFFSLVVVLGAYAVFSPQFRTFAIQDIAEQYQYVTTGISQDAMETFRFWAEVDAAIASEWKNGEPLKAGVGAVASVLLVITGK